MDYEGTFVKTRILLVDDDEVCLQIVSGMLKTWSYEVATVTHPMEALSILQLKQFDLILSDYHMPDMSGIELQKRVQEEFKLPVIIMSSDDRKNRICTSLQGGALYYLMKPVKLEMLRNVWQYAIAKCKENAIVLEESKGAGQTSSLPCKRVCHDQDVVPASSSADDSKSTNSKEISKKRVGRRILKIYEEHPPPPRKAKVVWTNSLHDRFLQSINILGLDKAVPKRILEVMNVPGLSRENIASHLQKYRIFLKRVAENGSLKFKSPENALNSNFASNILPSTSSPANQYSRPFQLGIGMFSSILRDENPSFLQFPNLGAPGSSSTLPRLGFERSNPLHGNTSATNPLYGGRNFHFGQSSGLSPSSIQIPPTTLGLNFPLQGKENTMYNHPKDHLRPLDIPMQIYQSQQSGTTISLGFDSGISGFNNGLALNANEGNGNMGNNVFPPRFLSPNPPISNYVGFRLTNNGELVGGEGGQSRLNDFGINMNRVENNNHNEFDLANLQSILYGDHETGLPTLPLEQEVVTNQGANNTNNNLKFDTTNNGPSLPNDNNTNYQHPLGDGDHSNVFAQQVNQPYMNGQDLMQHPDITNGSYIVDYESNVPPNELLDSNFSNLYQAQDNIPLGDPISSQQYKSNGELMETNTRMTGLVPNGGFPSSILCPEQQQQGLGEQLLDSVLPPLNQNSVEQTVANENTMVNDQDWEQDEYIESLLGSIHEFLGD